MQITKPEQILLNQAYHSLNGQAYVFISLLYLLDANNQALPEQQAWPWLLAQDELEPIDYGLKKASGVFGISGAAYAPGGQAAANMLLTARVGGLEKKLLVHGDRTWLSANKLSNTATFSQMPVDLAHAFGGSDFADNPYGKGYVARHEDLPGTALPNIELASKPIVAAIDTPPVATFGALAAAGTTRASYLGPLDNNWLQQRLPWVPDGTKPQWFNLVADDQAHSSYWQGTESWSITGMHPSKPEVSGTLPGIKPRLLVKKQVGDVFEADLSLDTIWLFPAAEKVLLAYRAAIAVEREDGQDIAVLAAYDGSLNQPQAELAALLAQTPELQPDPSAAVGTMTAATAVASDPELEQTIQAQRAALVASTQAEFDQATAESNQELARAKAQTPYTENFDLEPFSAPDIQALTANSPTAAQDVDFAAIGPNIERDLQQELDQADAQVDKILDKVAAQHGLNKADLKAIAAANRSQADSYLNKSATELIRDLKLPDDLSNQIFADAKVGLLADAQAFETQMQSVDSKLAAVRQMLGLNPDPGAVLAAATATITNASQLRQRLASGTAVAPEELKNIDFSGQDLSNTDFSQLQFESCNFSAANLTASKFKQALITDCTFTAADLTDCDLNAADIKQSNFDNARLNQANLSNANLLDTSLQQANLSLAKLDSASLGNSNCQQADFTAASLNTTTFWAVDATAANFSNAVAPGLRIDSNAVFANCNFDQADLSNASLQDSQFQGASFNQANLTAAFIKACDLSATSAWRLDAKEACFKDSQIVAANWQAANLMQASFDQALLKQLDLSGANLFAVETRTAQLIDVLLQDALLERSRLAPDFATGGL